MAGTKFMDLSVDIKTLIVQHVSKNAGVRLASAMAHGAQPGAQRLSSLTCSLRLSTLKGTEAFEALQCLIHGPFASVLRQRAKLQEIC